jgi:hypothetical protein
MFTAKRQLLSFVLVFVTLHVYADDKGTFIDKFSVKKQDFVSTGGNPYFTLKPGFEQIFEGKEDGQPARLVITVLNETRVVDGVETRIVEERESVNNQPFEVSRNYFAVDKNTGDVYYFGEEVDMYKDGRVSGHEGSWESGKNGAHYGLFMPANPIQGQKFYQELAPKEAMDRCEVVSLNEKVTVPAGSFENVVKVKETTPLEPDTTEYKTYAPEVGLLADGGLKLVKFGPTK